MVLKEGFDFLLFSAICRVWNLELKNGPPSTSKCLHGKHSHAGSTLIDLDPAPGPNTAEPHWDCIGARG